MKNKQNKSFTIKIPVEVDFEGNKLSIETKSIKLRLEAENTKQAILKLENVLNELLSRKNDDV